MSDTHFILTADLHFGVTGRLTDILWAARVIREHARRHDIDTVCVLGDLHHDRDALSLDVLCASYRFLHETRHDYGQNWITFPGNHDMFLKHAWDITSLRHLVGVMTVIDTIKILMINDRRFWVLPFIHFESAYMKVLAAIEDRYEAGDVLLTHVGTRDAIVNTCFLLKDWSMVHFSDSKFDQIYTGHFHASQHVGRNVWYPGSPIPFKADEGDVPHGFFVYDTRTRTHTFVDIWAAGAAYFPDETPPPQYRTVGEEALAGLTATDIRHNIIRVALTRDYSDAEKDRFRQQLLDQGASVVRFIDPTPDTTAAFTAPVAAQEDISLAWIRGDTDGTRGLNVDLLLRLNGDIVQQADERYASTLDD